MGVYAAAAWRTFRRFATYRGATYAGAFTNSVFGCILAFTYIALWTARPHIGGYDVADAVTYVWLGQALLVTSGLFGIHFAGDLADRIRTGDIAIDLYRPVDLQGWFLATDLGRATYHLLARGVPPTVVGIALFHILLPRSPLVWCGFLASVLLAVVVSFALRYLVALTGFWIVESRGVEQAAGLLSMFLSGMVLPLTVFPAGLATVARALPWSACLQVPADIYLGKHPGPGLLGALGFQAGWAVVLLVGGRLLTAVATRKVVVQGG